MTGVLVYCYTIIALASRATSLFFLQYVSLTNRPHPSESHIAFFSFPPPCLLCAHRQWNLRMGAAQPILGAITELQDSMLHGLNPGARGGGQAGNRRGNTHSNSFLLSSGPQAERV